VRYTEQQKVSRLFISSLSSKLGSNRADCTYSSIPTGKAVNLLTKYFPGHIPPNTPAKQILTNRKLGDNFQVIDANPPICQTNDRNLAPSFPPIDLLKDSKYKNIYKTITKKLYPIRPLSYEEVTKLRDVNTGSHNAVYYFTAHI